MFVQCATWAWSAFLARYNENPFGLDRQLELMQCIGTTCRTTLRVLHIAVPVCQADTCRALAELEFLEELSISTCGFR